MQLSSVIRARLLLILSTSVWTTFDPLDLFVGESRCEPLKILLRLSPPRISSTSAATRSCGILASSSSSSDVISSRAALCACTSDTGTMPKATPSGVYTGRAACSEPAPYYAAVATGTGGGGGTDGVNPIAPTSAAPASTSQHPHYGQAQAQAHPQKMIVLPSATAAKTARPTPYSHLPACDTCAYPTPCSDALALMI